MLAQVEISSWNLKKCDFPDNLTLNIGDLVILKSENILEYGKIVAFIPQKNNEIEGNIERIINDDDRNLLATEEEIQEALQICRERIEANKLPMKLVGANYSFDRSKITFAFMSSERVDFRNLLKELNAKFKIFIKLYQIGVRDEARLIGDCGRCGRELCCKKFIHGFSSINSGMAETQQISHRGNERISGICGRLLCCLSFEQKEYEELLKELPKIGDKIKINGKYSEVVSLNPLKGSVNVKEKNSAGITNIIEIDPKTKKPL